MAKKLVLQGQKQVWKFLPQPQLMTDAIQLCIFSLSLHFYGKCQGIPAQPEEASCPSRCHSHQSHPIFPSDKKRKII